MATNGNIRFSYQAPARPEQRRAGMMREADAAHTRGDAARAEQIYREITRLFPDFADAWHFLGVMTYERGAAREALKALEEAERLSPDNATLLCDLAIVLGVLKDYQGALGAIERAYDCAEHPERVLEQHARTLLDLNRGDELIEAFRRHFAQFGEDWRLRLRYGECLLQGGRPQEARSAFARAASEAPPGESEAILRKARDNASRGRLEAARKDFLAARGAFPKRVEPLLGLAALASQVGDFTATEQLAERALELDERAWNAWFLLARLPGRQDPAAFAQRLDRVAAAAGDDPDAWPLHSARGVVEEKLGHYEKAFAAFSRANSWLDAGPLVSERGLDASLANLRSNLGAAFVERAQAIGVADPGAIFICGMPRSGTTLIETILASHPKVAAGGEMRWVHEKLTRRIGWQPRIQTAEWLAGAEDSALRQIASEWAQKLTAEKQGRAFITDKMPSNFILLGFIHVCFPQARIVHLNRDPRDNCLSYFTTPFDEKNEFSYDLENVAQYYKYQERLMAHWRAILGPERIIEVQYEEVVRNPEAEIRKLLDALGLDWDARCLDFHKSRRTVGTASQFQVRQPVYTSSIGRWRHYERQLQPLIRELGKPAPEPETGGAAAQPAPAPSLAPPAAADRVEAGKSARERGEHDRAKAEFEAALALAPRDSEQAADIRYELARLASDEGDFTGAETLLRQALKLNPQLYWAWEELSLIRSSTPPGTLAAELDAAIAKAPTAAADPEVRLLWFARARLRERRGDYAGAFSDYSEGNRLLSPADVYSRELQTNWARDIVTGLDREFTARRVAPAAAAPPRPIFVCGMYRSGTTLVEAILASHPEVSGGGEMHYIHDRLRNTLGEGGLNRTGSWLASRPDATLADIAQGWRQSLVEPAAGRPWLTDKMPANYALLGLIQVVFSDAPIVHVRRDPRDTCLSCFATPFEPRRLFATLEGTGHRYRLYERLMQHWRETLGPERIVEIDYERLVTEPEPTIRRLLDAIGLDWDARCLEFHKTARPINTASVYQVRQPIYTGSIGRAERFREHLAPLDVELAAPLTTILERGQAARPAATPDPGTGEVEQRVAPSPEAARRMRAAVAAQRRGDLDKAEADLRELVRRYPRFADARHFYGLLLFQKGDKNNAMKFLTEAQDLDPDNLHFLLNFARAALESKRPIEAVACLLRAHKLAPERSEITFGLAQCLIDLERGGEMAAEIERHAMSHAHDWRIWMLLGQCREQAGDFEDALAAFAKAAELAPVGVVAPHIMRGNTASYCSRKSLAKSEFEAALAIAADSPDARLGLARLEAEAGNLEQARRALREIVRQHPDFYPAWQWLSMVGAGAPGGLAEELETVSKRAGDDSNAWLLDFALGREREKLGDYESAFAAYARGNRARRQRKPYARARDGEHARDIIASLDKDFVTRALPDTTAEGITPVFVCGMPRSGTTLVETILAAHPEVRAGGEQRFIHDRLSRSLGAGNSHSTGSWLRDRPDEALAEMARQWQQHLMEMAAGHACVTDKMPSNYSLLGLIQVCLPAARIVHVRRDARDTGVSCFATAFRQAHSFSCELADIGYHYRLYEALMGHWRQTLSPGRIIEIEYEALVGNPEPEIRRLLAAVGLPWDDRCLEFHAAKRDVSTASVAQVRQPLYSSSIGRWRHFEPHLAPLMAALQAPLEQVLSGSEQRPEKEESE